MKVTILKRKHLSLRRITTSGRDLPTNVQNIVDSFLSFCHANFLNINRDLLCNMDETSIYLDSPSHVTYNPIGDKRIPSVATGNERTRISDAFTASVSGNQLKPLILIPRKKPLKDFVVPVNVIVVYGTKGTFNENIISEAYLTRVVEPYMHEKKSRVVDLLIDHATCHLTTKVKLALKSRNIKAFYLFQIFLFISENTVHVHLKGASVILRKITSFNVKSSQITLYDLF